VTKPDVYISNRKKPNNLKDRLSNSIFWSIRGWANDFVKRTWEP